jgi:hypothetical protein
MLSFGTLALAVASAAANYKVTLAQPSFVGNTELKAGDYKIEVDGDKATLNNGKESVQLPVKVETGSQKFYTNGFQFANSDGKYRLEAIRLGGTKTTLVFSN